MLCQVAYSGVLPPLVWPWVTEYAFPRLTLASISRNRQPQERDKPRFRLLPFTIFSVPKSHQKRKVCPQGVFLSSEITVQRLNFSQIMPPPNNKTWNKLIYRKPPPRPSRFDVALSSWRSRLVLGRRHR